MTILRSIYILVKSVTVFFFSSMLYEYAAKNTRRKTGRIIYKALLSLVKLEHQLSVICKEKNRSTGKYKVLNYN
ncbi:MAG: hypothetical protein JW864_08845 [Spirochaetes bacterium]|nr:hypothetical protein [Spirochaetota bacterium]